MGCGCNKAPNVSSTGSHYALQTPVINVVSTKDTTEAIVRGQIAVYLSALSNDPNTELNIVTDGEGPFTEDEIRTIIAQESNT